MNLLCKGAQQGRLIAEVTPASANWQYVGFRAERLGLGESSEWFSEQRELCLVILSGALDLSVTTADRCHEWPALASRNSVFDDSPPMALYVPPNSRLKLTACSAAELAFCSAPSNGGLPVRLIPPDSMRQSVRGQGANTRYVTDILPQDAAADSLLVVEVRTPSGHSSSYPPHKHDRDCLPQESRLEETYYHRLDPPQGFAFQRVYTDDRRIDQAMAAENHDVVMVPEGYHPVCVPYGYQSYYLNVMAGPQRAWHFQNDPQHEWLLHQK